MFYSDIVTFNGKSEGTEFHNNLYLESPTGAFSGVIFNNVQPPNLEPDRYLGF